jgi:hypothetical protein
MATYRWRLVQTPNPSEFAFAVNVPQDTVGKNPTFAPQPGDLFKNLGVVNGKSYGWIPDPALAQDDRFGLYEYVQMAAFKAGDDAMFIYGKPKTAAQKDTPFREIPEFGNHYWPPMLLLLKFIPDRNFPITTQGAGGQMIVGYRHYVREVFIPGANEGSMFITREYFAPTQFEIGQAAVPEPTAVSYDYLGARGSFPECLHERIRIPAMRTAFASYTTGGGSAGASGVLAGQIFPATNFTEWAPYILSDKQTLTEGGWHRIQVEVYPPPIPDTIIR